MNLQISKAYVLIAMSLELVNREQALAGISLSEEELLRSETVPLTHAAQIVNNIYRYGNQPNWAARFGDHLGVATHGPVGYAAVSAPTIGRALSTFIDWFQLRCHCYTGKIEEHDEFYDILIDDLSHDEGFKTFFFEAITRAFEILITLLAGNQMKVNTELFFETQAHNRKHLMQQSYLSKLHFGSTANRFRVPKSLWFMGSPLSDKDSHSLNLRKCEQLRDSMTQTSRLDISVQNLLRDAIDSNRPIPSCIQISEALHLSERTLVRKLNQCGTSYTSIVETQRKFFAHKFLMDARYSVANISDLLGYTEPASFCRAFKRWHGISPSSYRRNPPIVDGSPPLR